MWVLSSGPLKELPVLTHLFSFENLFIVNEWIKQILVTEFNFLRMMGNNYILEILAITLIAVDLATSSAE